jgi:hypothetical protein
MVVRGDGRLLNVAKVYTKSKSRALLQQIIAPTFICIVVYMVDQACSVSVVNFPRGFFVSVFPKQ